MSSSLLSSLLPNVNNNNNNQNESQLMKATKNHSLVEITSHSNVPKYGSREGWVPRTQSDYEDGGAFPEIHCAQYPLDLGLKDNNNVMAVAVQLDAGGRIKYESVLGHNINNEKVVYHRLQDLLPHEMNANGEEECISDKPDEEEVQRTTEETRLALQKLTQTKISAALPVKGAAERVSAQYMRYTGSGGGGGGGGGEGSEDRIIRMVEVQRDPLEPPRFKINKKIPMGPPSPPPPVMHSPTRKVTVKEQQEWRIPPCISNWKNAKGYTVPLDKRLAADGRGLQQMHINEGFAKLSEALYIADRKAREAVEMRAQMERKIAQKEREKKEDHLRLLAQRAREERAGIRGAPQAQGVMVEEEEVREREHIRHERHRERQRERNLQRAGPEKRSRAERDISEQIALGVAANHKTSSSDVQFDVRLFDGSKGLSSGFGDDDDYGVYDRPWRSTHALSQNIYRPTKGSDVNNESSSDAVVVTTQKEFVGSVEGVRRDGGPVQFEKHVEEEDPFGLDKFLTEVKKASKRPEVTTNSSSGGVTNYETNRSTYYAKRRKE